MTLQGSGPGPQGGVRTYGDGPITHHSSPAGLPGPLRWFWDLAVYVLGGWVLPRYYPSPVPTRSPYPTLVHPPVHGTLRCSHGRYSCFEVAVGEPRGLRTH